MRVAVVHDWLVTWGGAERVLEQILMSFPSADVYCIVEDLEAERRTILAGREVQTSFIQRLPRAKRDYWYYAALMPLAIEQFDMTGYDVIVSSSHAAALGVITGPDQLHVSYLHSPMRFAWDLQAMYLDTFALKRVRSGVARLAFHYLRMWDRGAGNGVDRLLVCSHFAGRRATKVYRRPVHVVYPPVDTARFTLSENRDRYFLTGSRMNPFKRIDLVVEAFRELPSERLVVMGDGPDFDKVRRVAGPNVELVGRLTDAEVVRAMQNATAFVHAAKEDFGIAMAEAQSCGTPVVALGAGGATEIVTDIESGPTPSGVLFAEQSAAGVREGIERFLANRDAFSPQECRANALRFGIERFRSEVQQHVRAEWDELANRTVRAGWDERTNGAVRL
jgi:glycosyltransferase involved in cell wall biosynthesis